MTKSILYLQFVLLICSKCFAQNIGAASVNRGFPAGWIGNWKGTLEWYQPDKIEPQKVAMELRIKPSDTLGQFSWNLIYGTSANDNRGFLLKPIDTAKGHWVTDELNGIVIDQFFIGDKFFGVFTTQNATIVNSYWMEKGNLIVEFLTYSSKPVSKSGKGTEQVPFVDNYGVRSYQRAVLKRVGR